MIFSTYSLIASGINDDEIENSAFVNTGLVIEVGVPAFAIYIRPYIEYKNYSNSDFHHELIGAVSIGLRLKLLTEEEKVRRKEKIRKKHMRRTAKEMSRDFICPYEVC